MCGARALDIDCQFWSLFIEDQLKREIGIPIVGKGGA